MMVTEPHNFLHIKEFHGVTLMFPEEGADDFNINSTTEFQKYFGKKQPYFFIGYNHAVDLKNDEFLNSLSIEQKKEFDEEMMKIWANAPLQRNEDVWYMILEGNKGKKVGLYQDGEVFKKARDEDLLVHEDLWANNPDNGWSYKGCWFDDLASAKNYIQMARDEEGVHWDWPKEIPVIWKKGPLTQSERLGHWASAT